MTALVVPGVWFTHPVKDLPSFGPEFGVAPTDDPLSYPGKPPSTSTLLLGNAVLHMYARSRRRMPQWRVEVDEHSVPGHQRAADVLPLNYVLLRHNQAPMSARVPLLTVGSNASPAQMLGKLSRAGVSPVLPMVLAAEVRGVTVGISAHVSKPGYLPTTVVLDPDATCRLFVIWPDKAQLAAIDETEPNYHRVRLSEPDVTVVLPSGENLSHCYAYVSRHGNLTDDDGMPVTIPDAWDIRQHENVQQELIESVFGRDATLADLLAPGARPLTARLAREPRLRDSVRELYRQRGWVQSSPRQDKLVTDAGGDQHTLARPAPIGYDDCLPLHRVPPDAFRLRLSADDFDRHGQAVVRVAPAVADRLGKDHVLVSLLPVGDASGAIQALGRLVGNEQLTDENVVEVDQVLRNAIGAEVGEDIELTPVTIDQRTRADVLFGKPNYVTCRVQTADLTTVEREVCLMDDLTLSLLGVQPGDEVVIEGWAESGFVQQVRIKAFRITDDMRERRESLHGGDLSSRFPNALDALAVSPDLPWIFLDSSTRAALSLRGQKLATVRLRASRRFQLRKELREMLLLLGLAFFGLISILDNLIAQLVGLGALIAFVGAVVVIRMRGRLIQEMRRPRRRRLRK